MNDKALSTLIRAALFNAPGLEGIACQRNFQPRQQGANSSPTLYWVKIGEHPHGSPKRREVWNDSTSQFDHAEAQLIEATWQFMGDIPQDPAQVDQPTEADVLAVACAIMQSDAVISSFKLAGVGIQRVTQVRNPYVNDDRDRFAARPSFDVVLTHYRTRVTALPAVVAYDARISRV